MSGRLIMCYDINRKAVGDVAALAAARYARFHGMEFVVEPPPLNCSPWFYKVEAALQCRHSELAIIIDADVVMRKPSVQNRPPFCKHLAVSLNWAGLCTGFLMSANTDKAVRLLETWRNVGESVFMRYNNSPQDEASLKILCDHFRWIDKAITRIPTKLVSSPENGIKGTLAHHFVASAFPERQTELALLMMALIKLDSQ